MKTSPNVSNLLSGSSGREIPLGVVRDLSLSDFQSALPTLDVDVCLIDDEVVLMVLGSLAVVSPKTVRWHGQVPFLALSQSAVCGAVACKGVMDGSQMPELNRLLDAARTKRRSSFRRCSRCQQLTSPENRIDRMCHACAEATGTVF